MKLAVFHFGYRLEHARQCSLCPFLGKWQTLDFNMVPIKFFQQLLKGLGNPQAHAVRNTHHWRAPIFSPSSRKVTYRLFDITKLKEALEIQDVISLKVAVFWSGEVQVANNLAVADPIEALLAAKRKAHGQASRERITCRSTLVVGYGNGRATRELDIIWWPNLYNTGLLGKLSIRLHISRVELS